LTNSTEDRVYAESFGFQWQRFSKTQLDSFSGVRHSRQRLLDETGWPEAFFAGKLMLDAGCGAGRFAEVAADLGARVVALDYSSAIGVCAANLRDRPSVRCVQGDLARLPFEDGAFDAVYSLGVLQHTAEPPRVVAELARCVRTGGALAIGAYPRHWKARLQAKYVLRPLTKRLPRERLLRAVMSWVPRAVKLNRLLTGVLRVPQRVANNLTVCYYYKDIIPLNEQQLVDWAILDTFDALSPAYDQPQDFAEVSGWLAAAGFTSIHRPSTAAMCIAGTKS
jgi:2-polyprenyl-3-methyl-5-hydroxy-6-metoxy-1,4-benzoquinol methylase